jgi:hypothetical protein
MLRINDTSLTVEIPAARALNRVARENHPMKGVCLLRRGRYFERKIDIEKHAPEASGDHS